ncbi:hypothetical protein Z043_117705, partial [Scleropages formosus]
MRREMRSRSTAKAKMDNQVIGYKDLAAIPKDKAILDIERPDLMIYEPHFSYCSLDRSEVTNIREVGHHRYPVLHFYDVLYRAAVFSVRCRFSLKTARTPFRVSTDASRPERSMSPRSISPPPSPETFMSKEPREWLEQKSPGGSTPTPVVPIRRVSSAMGPLQHFHRPHNGTNIYKKPPIYKQDASASVPQSKHIEDLIIESSKFPAAQPPDPSQPSKIETDYWPCPPSLAVMESEWRKKAASQKKAEDDEEYDDGDLTEDLWRLKQMQKQELNKIPSNLGKLILKEEIEKSFPMRRKTRSLPDRTPMQLGKTLPLRVH